MAALPGHGLGSRPFLEVRGRADRKRASRNVDQGILAKASCRGSLGTMNRVGSATIRYGQFLDPFWKEFRRVFFLFNVANSFATATFQSDVPMSAVGAGAITPVVSPPKSPLVNGMDAFSFPSGVGSQPTLSWSPPVIGTASSYVVEIFAMTLDCNATIAVVGGVTTLVRSGTSFKVPTGILLPGTPYWVRITARQAPWDTADAGPFRTGTPLHTAQCVGGFTL